MRTTLHEIAFLLLLKIVKINTKTAKPKSPLKIDIKVIPSPPPEVRRFFLLLLKIEISLSASITDSSARESISGKIVEIVSFETNSF